MGVLEKNTSKMNSYVLGFCFSADGSPLTRKVVLIRKKKPQWQAGKLNGIGGMIESGEFASDAMVREFAEETTVRTMKSDWTPFVILRFGETDIHVFVTVNQIAFNLATTNTEERIEKHCAFDVPLMGNEIIPNLAWLLPMALTAPEVSGGITPIIKFG